jgi:hypothetical protein
MYIYPLSRMHNTSPVSAYFGLDKRQCECLHYLFIWYRRFIPKLKTIINYYNGQQLHQTSPVPERCHTLL